MEPPGAEKISVFDVQEIIECEEEPIDICSTGDGFLVATRNGAVFAYCLLMKHMLVHSFSTVYDLIEQVEYLPMPDCIVTREHDKKSGKNFTFAYFNWRQSQAGKNKKQLQSPTEVVVLKDPTVEVADRRRYVRFLAQELIYNKKQSTKGAKSYYDLFMSSIDIEGDGWDYVSQNSHDSLCVCQKTSRILVSSGYSLQLWDCSKYPAIVLMEFEVSTPYFSQILLHDSHLAYVFDKTMRVYEFSLVPLIAGPEKEDIQESTEDIENDSFCFDIYFDEDGEASAENSPAIFIADDEFRNCLPGRSGSEALKSHECLGPVTDTDFGVHVLCDSYELTGFHLLIDREFEHPLVNMLVSTLDSSGGPAQASKGASKSGKMASGKDSEKKSLLPAAGAVDFVVATLNNVYIYDISMGKVEQISYYIIPNEIKLCAISHSLMYLLHDNSLSVWTMHVPGTGKNCPIRICDLTFFSLRKIAFQEDNVILMSKFVDIDETEGALVQADGINGRETAGKASWNLYALLARPFTAFIDDILKRSDLLSINRAEYIDYLREIMNFVLARMSEAKSKDNMVGKDQVDFYNEQMESLALIGLLRKCGFLLAGAYYEESRYEDAATLYGLSGIPLSTAYRALKGGKGKYKHAMMTYLEDVLFNENSAELMDESTEIGNKIISFYHEQNPSRLLDVILHSTLKSYSQDVVLKLLKGEYESESVDYEDTDRNKILFTIILLSVDLDRMDSAIAFLKKLDEGSTYLFLKTVVDLILLTPEQQATSETGKEIVLKKSVSFQGILIETAPFILLEVLTEHASGEVPLSKVISLFCGTSEITSNLEDKVFLKHSLLVECYIESFLDAYMRMDTRQKYSFKEEVFKYSNLLMVMYFTKILRGNDEEEMMQGGKDLINTFKSTSFCQKWLKFHDLVFNPPKKYPFISNNDEDEEKEDEEGGKHAIPMMGTQFYFNKLLMLIVSGITSNFEALLGKTEKLEDEGQRVAINCLCYGESNRIDKACDILMKYDVQLLPQFCEMYCRSHTDWIYPLDLLTTVLRSDPEGVDENAMKCFKVYRKCLDVLVEKTTPRQFLSLLPGDGSFSFFIDLIIRNANRHSATTLQGKILSQCNETWMKEDSTID